MKYNNGVIGYKQQRILRELFEWGGSCDRIANLHHPGEGAQQPLFDRIKRMRERGLIETRPLGIGRAKMVVLTDAGRELAAKLVEEFDKESGEGIHR